MIASGPAGGHVFRFVPPSAAEHHDRGDEHHAAEKYELNDAGDPRCEHQTRAQRIHGAHHARNAEEHHARPVDVTLEHRSDRREQGDATHDREAFRDRHLRLVVEQVDEQRHRENRATRSEQAQTEPDHDSTQDRDHATAPRPSRGPAIDAAIATRCRMPPDSSCG